MNRKLTPEPVNRWVDAYYGSRWGFVLTWWYRMLHGVGLYRRYGRVDWDSVERLVFVCKGNVCRSAFAEAVARANGLSTVSCGIEAGVDRPAYAAAIMAADLRGFSLAEHRTTPLGKVEVRDNDLLIAMEPWQAEHLHKVHGSTAPCTLLGLWGGRKMPHIHDPYGMSPDYFNHCFEYLEDTVHEISRKIKKTA